jgi:hypothetical protein
MQANNNTDDTKEQPVSAKFSNGWLDGLDGRLGIARELRGRFEALTGDLGGSANLSYAQRSLCERALFLEFWLARQEAALANGKPFDVGKWTQACNSLQGIFAKLGLKRPPKDVLDIEAWVKKHQAQQAPPHYSRTR